MINISDNSKELFVIYKRHPVLKKHEDKALAVTCPDHVRVFSGNSATLQEYEGYCQKAIAVWLDEDEQQQLEDAMNDDGNILYYRKPFKAQVYRDETENTEEVDAFALVAHPVAFAMQMIDEEEADESDPQRGLDFDRDYVSIDLMFTKIRNLPDTPETIDIEVLEAGSLEHVRTVTAQTHFVRSAPKRQVHIPQPVKQVVEEPKVEALIEVPAEPVE